MVFAHICHDLILLCFSFFFFFLADQCLTLPTLLLANNPLFRETFNFHNFSWSTPVEILQCRWGIVSSELMTWRALHIKKKKKNKIDGCCFRGTFSSLVPCHLAEASLRQQRRGVTNASPDWPAVCACLIYPRSSSVWYSWFTALQEERRRAPFRHGDAIRQVLSSPSSNSARKGKCQNKTPDANQH